MGVYIGYRFGLVKVGNLDEEDVGGERSRRC